MEWLRWYHGCVTDPKFAFVARKANQSVAAVIAVWAALLERASSADERGSMLGFDAESFDVVFGLEEGACEAIVVALRDKELIVGNYIAKWNERQPKSEDNSKERVRAFRERQKQNNQQDVTACNDTKQDVTTCNGMEQNVTPRLDKIREEKSEDIRTPHTPLKFSEGKSCADAENAKGSLGGGEEENTNFSEFEAEPTSKASRPKKLDSPSKATPEWSAFCQCFELYPVQQGKEEAWREWCRLKANNTLALAWEIKDKILLMGAEDSWWQKGKVPKMAKWLSGKGWEDEPHKAVDAVARASPVAVRGSKEDLAKQVLSHFGDDVKAIMGGNYGQQTADS